MACKDKYTLPTKWKWLITFLFMMLLPVPYTFCYKAEKVQWHGSTTTLRPSLSERPSHIHSILCKIKWMKIYFNKWRELFIPLIKGLNKETRCPFLHFHYMLRKMTICDKCVLRYRYENKKRQKKGVLVWNISAERMYSLNYVGTMRCMSMEIQIRASSIRKQFISLICSIVSLRLTFNVTFTL